MKRTPIHRKTPMRRSKPRATVRRSSPLPAPVHPEAREVHAGPREPGAPIEKPLRLRSETWLSVVRLGPCRRCGALIACDPHHVVRRGTREDDFDPLSIPLCGGLRGCHRTVEDMPRKERDRIGWMLLGEYLCHVVPRLSRDLVRRVLSELLASVNGG